MIDPRPAAPADGIRPGARSARELAAAYRSGELTPVDVAEDVLTAIAVRNGTLNAFAELDPDAVRAAASESTRRHETGAARGPLDGVPVTVKENLRRAGIPYRAGTAASEPWVPERNSPAVDRLLEAGAVIVGSTTMPDWGMLSSGVSSLHGVTRSPWNPEWTVGGSSAGAGAAAAAGFGAVHLGSDIGGSVRFPATWAGLASLKPSAGRVPHDDPYFGRAIGPIARTVDDLAVAMAVIARPDGRDYTALPAASVDWSAPAPEVRGLRIGVQLSAGAGMEVEADTLAAVRAAAETFAEAGAVVVEVPPFLDERMLAAVDRFWRVRFWNTALKLPDAARERLLPYIAAWCAAGADVPGHEVLEAYDTMQEIRRAAVAAVGSLHAVLSPVAPVAAFPAEWPMPFGDEDRGMAHIAFTVPYNLSGQPAATVNAGFTADGRTIGVQLAGRPHDDAGVLALARWYEAHRPAHAVPAFPV